MARFTIAAMIYLKGLSLYIPKRDIFNSLRRSLGLANSMCRQTNHFHLSLEKRDNIRCNTDHILTTLNIHREQKTVSWSYRLSGWNEWVLMFLMHFRWRRWRWWWPRRSKMHTRSKDREETLLLLLLLPALMFFYVAAKFNSLMANNKVSLLIKRETGFTVILNV